MASQENKIISILAQVFGMSLIVPILLYYITKDRYIRENAKRSIQFHLLIWCLYFVLGIVSALLTFVTFGLFGFLSGIILFILKISYIIFIAYICIQIWNGGYANYPLIHIFNKKSI